MTPAPTPGVTSAANAYQAQFATAYRQSKDPRFKPFYLNQSGGDTGPVENELTVPQRFALVKQLAAQGLKPDEEIEGENMDPLTVMRMRELMGNTWEPVGTGDVISEQVIVAGMYSGPVPPTGILVSTNIADYPPFPTPPAPPAPPAPGKIANPIGTRVSFNFLNAIGDWFRPLANDGYNVTDTWSGTSGAYSGTWTKQALEMGMMIIWTKTA